MLKVFPGKLVMVKNESLQKPAIDSYQRIPELDGLRGIAIILVISFHYLNNQLVHSQAVLGKFVGKLTSFGWVGVDLFFVLSGFLIGSILIRNKGSENYFSTFYKKRLLRIVPNYYLLLFLFVLITTSRYFSDSYFVTGNNKLSFWTYLTLTQNFFMASLNNMGNSAMSVTWSIAIEEQFYIVVPMLIFFINNKHIPYFLIALMVSACLIRYNFTHWVPSYVLLVSRMDALSLGVLIAWLNTEFELSRFVNRYMKIIIGILVTDVVLCLFLFVKYQDLGGVKHSLFAIFFGIALLFALTFKKGLYGKLLRNKALVWIGTVSYSLYLFHYLILGVFHHLAGNKGGIGISSFYDIALTAAALATSLLFAAFTYKRLETPLVNYGKRFRY